MLDKLFSVCILELRAREIEVYFRKVDELTRFRIDILNHTTTSPVP